MEFITRLKGFLKTGKINTYDLLKMYLCEKQDITEIVQPLQQLSELEKDNLVNEVWDKISEKKQEKLAAVLYLENWNRLINNYGNLKEEKQIRTLEILGFIPHNDVVDFLIEQMKSKKESIRLTASSALKKQDPSLTMEPMLLALTRPDQWLPSRVFEILNGVGPQLTKSLIELINRVNIEVQQVIVQILGEIGDVSCLPVLERFAQSPERNLRKRAAEALKQLALKDSWPILVKLMEDTEWQTRMQAAQALGILGIPEAIPLLKQRKCLEKEQIVKECIEEALEQIEEVTLPTAVSWVREGK